VDAITLRSIERIVAVVIGGVSIYLCYRLFLAMPERQEGEGKVLLPGGISIYMTRMGPGAFFALFGAIVVAISFHHAITYKESPGIPLQSGEPSAVSRAYTGFGGADPTQALQLSRLQMASDIKFLNTTLPQLLRKDLSKQNRTDVEILIPRLKLAMIKTVWGPDWGDFAKFKEWVESGATEPAPKDLVKPTNLYLHGDI